jgi:hypothetical protein
LARRSTLEVHVRKLDLALPYSYNGFSPTAGIPVHDLGD